MSRGRRASQTSNQGGHPPNSKLRSVSAQSIGQNSIKNRSQSRRQLLSKGRGAIGQMSRKQELVSQRKFNKSTLGLRTSNGGGGVTSTTLPIYGYQSHANAKNTLSHIRDLRAPMFITSEQSLLNPSSAAHARFANPSTQTLGHPARRPLHRSLATRSPNFKYIIQHRDFVPEKTWEQQLRQNQHTSTLNSIKYYSNVIRNRS